MRKPVETEKKITRRDISDLLIEKNELYEGSWEKFCVFLENRVRDTGVPPSKRSACAESLEIIKKIQVLEAAGKTWKEILRSASSITEVTRESISATLQPSCTPTKRQAKRCESDEEKMERLMNICNLDHDGSFEKFVAHLNVIIKNRRTHWSHRANALSDREYIWVNILQQDASLLPPSPFPKRKKPSQQ